MILTGSISRSTDASNSNHDNVSYADDKPLDLTQCNCLEVPTSNSMQEHVERILPDDRTYLGP